MKYTHCGLGSLDEIVGKAVSITIDPVYGSGQTNSDNIQAVCINDDDDPKVRKVHKI